MEEIKLGTRDITGEPREYRSMERIVFSVAISIIILGADCSNSKNSLYMRISGLEMKIEQGIIDTIEVDSRVQCAYACYITERCSAFQIRNDIKPGAKASCMILDANVRKNQPSYSFDYYQICPDTCLNGGVRASDGCLCECPSLPKIITGLRCEKELQYKWKSYDRMDLDNSYCIANLWTGLEDERSCKEKCLQTEGCGAFTLSVSQNICDLSAVNLDDSDNLLHELGDDFVSFVLVPV